MTLDDAKRASMVIGSQDSLDSIPKQGGTNKVEMRDKSRPISKISAPKRSSKPEAGGDDKGTWCLNHCRRRLSSSVVSEVQSKASVFFGFHGHSFPPSPACTHVQTWHFEPNFLFLTLLSWYCRH